MIYNNFKEMNQCAKESEEKIEKISDELMKLYDKYGFVVFDKLLEINPYLNEKFKSLRKRSIRGGDSK